jgi:hypothetical protein
MSQNIINKIFLALLFVSVSFSSLCLGSDQYWISFQFAGPDKPAAPEGSKCILKIDAKGNIIIPPTIVVPNSRFVDGSNSGIALSHGNPGLLNMWLPGRNQAPLGYALFRAVVSKKTLKLLSIHKTAIRIADAANFQTSKKEQNDFLAALLVGTDAFGSYVGRRITATGLGAGQWLFPPYQFQCFDCSFGISDDGRIVFYTEEVPGNVGNQPRPLFLQHLDQSGRPSGQRVDFGQFVTAYDVTNQLAGGKRFLLYDASTPNGPSLFIQAIDAKTLQRTGKRIKIPSILSSDSLRKLALTRSTNLISIDPRGRFIILSGISGGFIVYVPLDKEGRPGPQKVLVHCCTPGSDGGIDLLKD